MFKCLVSGGCSFAYGFNLPDRNKRYAKLLADNMGAELIDRSAAGMCNEFIAAATVSGIIKAIEINHYKPEEIIVLVGWTTTERFEYFNRKVGRIMSGFVNATQHRHGDMQQVDKDRAEYITKELWDPSYGYYKLIHSFNYLHSFCKAQDIKIIHKANLTHYSARFPSIKLKNTRIDNNDLIQGSLTADSRKVFDEWSKSISFQKLIMRDTQKYTINPITDTHPNSTGHEMWGKRLIREYPEFSNLSSN